MVKQISLICLVLLILSVAAVADPTPFTKGDPPSQVAAIDDSDHPWGGDQVTTPVRPVGGILVWSFLLTLPVVL